MSYVGWHQLFQVTVLPGCLGRPPGTPILVLILILKLSVCDYAKPDHLDYTNHTCSVSAPGRLEWFRDLDYLGYVIK